LGIDVSDEAARDDARVQLRFHAELITVRFADATAWAATYWRQTKASQWSRLRASADQHRVISVTEHTHPGGMRRVNRKGYPTDVSGEEWSFAAPDVSAPQRKHEVREMLIALRRIACGCAMADATE
jgi:hypothetical protein